MNRPGDSIDLILASAGTGKTTRLTDELWRLLSAADEPIRPERVLATTFTVKAAGELVERARRRLLEEGEDNQAEQLLVGRIGTVNAVAGRLAAEFALDGGLSPVSEVLAEQRQPEMFRQAARAVIEAYAETLDPVARRLGLNHWRDDVWKMSELARQNGLEPKALHDCADRSWQGLRTLLAAPDGEADSLDKDLKQAVERAIEQGAASTDSTKQTRKTLDTLRHARPGLERPEDLDWQTWARLSKLTPGKHWTPPSTWVVISRSA